MNENSFTSVDELLKFTSKLEQNTNAFFKDWFSDSENIVVRTSGSTGVPKNILLKKTYMINSALATADFFDLGRRTTALCCLPVSFIAGKMMLVRALVCGFHLDIVEANSWPLKSINKTYDFCAMVPLQLSNSLAKIYLVDKLIVGGGVVSAQLEKSIQNLPTKIYATYGMTETITHIAVKPLNVISSISSRVKLRGDESHYQLLPDVSISKDKRNCLVIHAPKISDDKITTNDVVEIVSEEEFVWKGRYDNVINSGGIKLYPEEIERKLSPFIDSRFFVAGISDERLGEQLVLLIEGDSYGVNENIFSSLSKYEKPKQIFFTPEFVETSTKKIQRQKTLDLL